MGKPVATLGSSHICPQFDGNKPHVGGQVIEGSNNVFIEKKPVCRQGDKLLCNSPNINQAGPGSSTVFVNGKSISRMGDTTAHQGQITNGAASVMAG